ncbi:MAG: DUF4172 domain-containing protein [Zetaproteobacteria bacterium CG_4_9_14_3_um_filter_53_7]|nr:MAG: DUF4172 domain-containing protein [Zetaproteobacteria bacterium CG_4_9_14_3_um_filter_53_7]
MKWIWQYASWPEFEYDPSALQGLEEQFKLDAFRLIGAVSVITEEQQQRFTIDLMSEEALKSSGIEGELLNRDSVISSLLQQFGLIPQHHHVLASDKEKGIAALMIDNYRSWKQPLTHELLCKWHPCVVSASFFVRTVGEYRNSPVPMQIVSGYEGNRKVHYEAPPADRVLAEMDAYIQWFNDTAPDGKHPLPALTRAGIAHLYFEAIHPFDDGNGRLGRALSEKALAQSLGMPGLFALSHIIEKNRADYYRQLEVTEKGLAIDGWLNHFATTALDAVNYSHSMMKFIIEKTRLFDRIGGRINERQHKALVRMFAEGMDGFKGGLSAKNYMSITGAPVATATRDLLSLVELGVMTKTGQLKGTRYWLNLGEAFDGPRKTHLAEKAGKPGATT